MKTLDEVIKAFEWCLNDANDECDGCPYYSNQETDCHFRNVDALYYLKWFLARDNMSRKLDREDNEPLTWDELRTMVGKPVWVSRVGKNRWAIVAGFYMDAFGIEKACIWMPHDYWNLKKEEVESTVKVYRKEKK